MRNAGLNRFLAALVCLAATAPAVAQEYREPGPSDPMPTMQPQPEPPEFIPADNNLPYIYITGYWPPTNNMLRQFSNSPDQNPNWTGQNWEGSGYNVVAFFPEFPGQTGPSWGRGEGDFEVDYQDTSNDWWPLVNEVRPIAITTFSRAGNDFDWEMEGGNRNYSSVSSPLWAGDYLTPFRPTPELPSYDEPVGNERFSSLPMTAIADAVNEQIPSLFAYIDAIDTSNFLSNYIGYHGNWYHDLHADRTQPNWNVAAGHIHVGFAMSDALAAQAAEVTMRVLIEHVDRRRADLDDSNDSQSPDADDLAILAACLNGPDVFAPPAGCTADEFFVADIDLDGDVDLKDFQFYQRVAPLAP